MTKLSFGKARRDDIAQVLANEVAAYVIPWGKQALIDSLQEQYQFWLAIDDGRIIGHLIFQPVVDESHLLNVCIHPRHQGQGFGEQLMNFWFAKSQQMNLHRLFLEVRVSNDRAIALYQKFGFELLSRRKHYYPLPDNRREDGLIMACELNHVLQSNVLTR